MALQTNVYRAGEEHFSGGGDEYIENARSIFSHTHKLLATSYQKRSSENGGPSK